MRIAVGTMLVLVIHLAAHAAPPQPAPQPEKQGNAQSLYQRNGGSLLKATLNSSRDPNRAGLADVSFFAVPEPEPKTLKKHDLVTIIIREESAFRSKGATDLKKSHELEARLEEFVKLQLSNFAIKGGALSDTPPSVKYSANRDFKGEGSVDRSDSMTARVTAEVVDVKPNGTLVLQARSRTRNDEEESEITLSGVCTAESVTPDNTILSTQLYDLDITKKTKGAVRDNTKRGWLPKLLDVINPF